jgi:hypothetical protein
LKVFAELPADQVNTRIHETFVPLASPPEVPRTVDEWASLREGWLASLREKSFRGWPVELGGLDVKPAFSAKRDGLQLSAHDFTSEEHIRLRLYVMHRAGLAQPELAVLNALDEEGWTKWLAAARCAFAEEFSEETLPAADQAAFDEASQMLASQPWALVYIAPRGIGPTAWDQSEQKQVQHRRRFMLLGQTLEGMQTWDVRRAVQALRTVPGFDRTPVWLQGERAMAGVALYASLFEPDIARLDLSDLPATHRDGPIYLNVLRYLDMPQALAMAAERSNIVLYQESQSGWEYSQAVAAGLGWEQRIRIREPVVGE